MTTTNALCFWVEETCPHGYTHTTIHMSEYRRSSIADRIEGARTNSDGYGSAEAAASRLRVFEILQQAGFSTVYDNSSYYGLSLELEWQHYRADDEGRMQYCEVTFSHLGRSLDQISRSLDFIKGRLGRTLAAADRRERTRRGREERGYGEDYVADARNVSSDTFSSPELVLAALRRMKGCVEVVRHEIRAGRAGTGNAYPEWFLVPIAEVRPSESPTAEMGQADALGELG